MPTRKQARERMLTDVKYELFKAILTSEYDLPAVASRAGFKARRIEYMLLSSVDLNLRFIGEMTYALDCEPSVKLWAHDGTFYSDAYGVHPC